MYIFFSILLNQMYVQCVICLAKFLSCLTSKFKNFVQEFKSKTGMLIIF